MELSTEMTTTKVQMSNYNNGSRLGVSLDTATGGRWKDGNISCLEIYSLINLMSSRVLGGSRKQPMQLSFAFIATVQSM